LHGLIRNKKKLSQPEADDESPDPLQPVPANTGSNLKQEPTNVLFGEKCFWIFPLFNADENKKSPIASKTNRLGLLYGWRLACRAIVPLPAG